MAKENLGWNDGLLTRRQWLRRSGLGLAAVGLTSQFPSVSRGDELEPEYKATVAKGLEWLNKNQNRAGYWEGTGGQYKPAMTGLAGMALLMEGSTLNSGKYSTNIRRAVDWFMERSQRNGLLVNPNDQAEVGRYMYGHGFGLLFLASVHGEETDNEQRRKLEDVITRAVQFTCKAQSSRGGWYYTSRLDGGDMDEGSVAVTQMQALRAARNAGIIVPKETIDKAEKYLEVCSVDKGSGMKEVGYQPGRPAITPGLTSAGIANMFCAGKYDAPIIKQWMKYCQANIGPLGGGARRGHDEYTHYYWAQDLYILGEDRFNKLFPDLKTAETRTWKRYRDETFKYLVKSQSADGSWSSAGGSHWSYIGTVYVTAIYLTILQLDKGTLPIYQR
jgi:hypothetical protein